MRRNDGNGPTIVDTLIETDQTGTNTDGPLRNLCQLEEWSHTSKRYNTSSLSHGSVVNNDETWKERNRIRSSSSRFDPKQFKWTEILAPIVLQLVFWENDHFHTISPRSCLAPENIKVCQLNNSAPIFRFLSTFCRSRGYSMETTSYKAEELLNHLLL